MRGNEHCGVPFVGELAIAFPGAWALLPGRVTGALEPDWFVVVRRGLGVDHLVVVPFVGALAIAFPGAWALPSRPSYWCAGT